MCVSMGLNVIRPMKKVDLSEGHVGVSRQKCHFLHTTLIESYARNSYLLFNKRKNCTMSIVKSEYQRVIAINQTISAAMLCSWYVHCTFFVRKLMLFSNRFPLAIFGLVFGRGKAFPPFPSKFLGSINKGCSMEHALFRGCCTR